MVPRQHRSITSVAEQEQGMAATTAIPASAFSLSTIVRRSSQVLVVVVPVLLLLLFVIYPLAAMLLQSVFPNIYATSPNLIPGLTALKEVTKNPQNYLALTNSLWQAAITATLSAILGTFLAILAKRTDLPIRRSMDVLVWIVFFTPSFLVGEAWSLFFIRGGIPDQYFHFSDAFLNFFFSPVGVIFILSLKTFPYVYISVTAALRWLGSEFEDAARIVGARTWRAWLSINAPLLLPAILAAALIAFAEALSDFGTAATIAQNSNVLLITYQIYTAINTSPVDFALAAGLSLLLVVAISIALLTQAAILRTRSFQVISGRNRPARPVPLGVWKWPVTVLCVLIFFVALVIPLGMCLLLSFLHAFGLGLVPNNWTLDNYTQALAQGSDALDALIRTFWLAFGTATITALVGLPIAFIIRRTTLPGRQLLSLFTLVTIAVPGIILACGYIFAWNAPYLQYVGIGGPQGIQFYGTVWLLLAAYIGGSLPYATRLGIGALEQVGQNMLDNARLQGASLFQILLRIVGPLLQANLVSVWLLVFTGTMFELAASELLYPPGQPTLPVQIVGLFSTFRMGPGMALSMLNVGLVIAVLLVFRSIPWLVVRAIRLFSKRKMAYVSTDKATQQELRVTAGRL